MRNVGANGGATARTSCIEQGAQGLFGMIWQSYPDLRENYVKPALRDLNIEVKDDDEFFKVYTNPEAALGGDEETEEIYEDEEQDGGEEYEEPSAEETFEDTDF